MRNTILSRLLLGCALAAILALGAMAMRAALPTPETPADAATLSAVTEAPVAGAAARPVLEVEASDPVMSPEPSPAVSQVQTAREEKPTRATSAKSRSACTGHGPASNDGDPEIVSRPIVAVDVDEAPERASSARSSRADRRVSSGPMRMLGGGESTW